MAKVYYMQDSVKTLKLDGVAQKRCCVDISPKLQKLVRGLFALQM